jgi:hypothetical protein
MPNSKDFEENRAQRLRQLDKEARDLDVRAARAINEKARIIQEIARIKSRNPPNGSCPECWLQYGVVHILIPIAMDKPEPQTERIRCTACGYEEIRRI